MRCLSTELAAPLDETAYLQVSYLCDTSSSGSRHSDATPDDRTGALIEV
jgi:hypothetical protein